jgi:polyferredoxin
VFFVTMPGAFVAGFTGVKNLFGWIGGGQLLQMNSFLKALIGLSLFTILFGRYFCGYICAFGSLGDFVYGLSGLVQKKLLRRKKQIALPRKALPWLQKLKYLNLIWIVVLCAFGLYSGFSGTSPWDVFSRLTALQGVPEGYLWGCVAFVLILVGMAVQERFFCQFLCPMGAVFALLPILPWGMLRRKEDLCIRGCNACANQCPVGLKLETDGHRNGECIGCEKCVSTCPKGNIGHVEQKIIPSQMALVLGKALLFFVLGVFLGFCRFL